jgi:hypothetical protein
MGKHLRKKWSEEEVIAVLERYMAGEIDAQDGQRLLKIKRRRFFDILKRYRQDSAGFSLAYQRKIPPRRLLKSVEKKIEQALLEEKKLIEDKHNPIQRYNYSYVKNQLEEDDQIDVSLSTIIRHAKKKGFINISRRGRATIAKC